MVLAVLLKESQSTNLDMLQSQLITASIFLMEMAIARKGAAPEGPIHPDYVLPQRLEALNPRWSSKAQLPGAGTGL